jgi:hypothetical protein
MQRIGYILTLTLVMVITSFKLEASIFKMAELENGLQYSQNCFEPGDQLYQNLENNLFDRKLRSIAEEASAYLQAARSSAALVAPSLTELKGQDQTRLFAIDLETFLVVNGTISDRIEALLPELMAETSIDPNERLLQLTALRNELLRLQLEYDFFEDRIARVIATSPLISSIAELTNTITRQIELKYRLEGLMGAVENYQFCHYNLLPDFLFFEQKLRVKRRYYNLHFTPLAKRLNGQQDLIFFVVDSFINQEKTTQGLIGKSMELFNSTTRALTLNNPQALNENWQKLLRRLRKEDSIIDVNIILSKIFSSMDVFKSPGVNLTAIKLNSLREKARTVNENLKYLANLSKACGECSREQKKQVRDEIKKFRDELKSLNIQYSDLYLNFLDQLKTYEDDLITMKKFVPLLITTLEKEISE